MALAAGFFIHWHHVACELRSQQMANEHSYAPYSFETLESRHSPKTAFGIGQRHYSNFGVSSPFIMQQNTMSCTGPQASGRLFQLTRATVRSFSWKDAPLWP